MLAHLLILALFRGKADLTFVRHAETAANATGRYNARTLNSFSEKGKAQIARLTEELLRQPRFDAILVSPSPRALKTIAPYLRATHQRAVIWPLLYECCTGRGPKSAHPTRFSYGSRITVPAELAPLFVINPNDNRLPVAADYNAGLAQVQAAIVNLERRNLVGRVLLVGHSGEGGHMLHDLTGKWQKLENAAPVAVGPLR